jgi:glycosyltransferase involved in cell wall biosynthesis
MSKENIEKIESALGRLETKENVIYFLTYDTKNNARAAIKHIYDMALTLKENGYTPKILTEDKSYIRPEWLGEKYDNLELVSIKEDKINIQIDDVIVVPEYYSNVLQQLSNVRCTKVMLIQQKEYIFETLPVGSRWSDYGFDRVIVTTESTKKYVQELFPESLVHIIPPIIGDNFKPTEGIVKPYIAISCRDRVKHRKFISEFYIKYPHLRWVTFKDMVQMTYEEFSEGLKDCMVSLWADDESTFGTFPLESIKSGVPIIGKIPSTEPDWLNENGMWTYDENKLVDILGTFVLAWLDGVELTDEVKQKMKETLLPYDTEITKNNILSIFNSFTNKRVETLSKALENLKKEQE